MAESIEALSELEEICRKQERIIIYGAGVVGSLLVQYMLKNGHSNKLVCIAVGSMANNLNNILGVPVYELNDLEDYKKDTLFIIGTYEDLQVEIKDKLLSSGCSEVKGISNSLCDVLRRSVIDFSVEIYNMLRMEMQQLQEVHEKVIQLEREADTLRESNEICTVNTKAFQGYENKFRGKEVVIVGAGPTLNHYDPIEGAIHIGVNAVFRCEKVHLDYLFAHDADRNFNYKDKFNGIDRLKCPVFIGRCLRGDWARDIEFPEDYRIGQNVHNYYRDIIPSKHIYRDICFHPLMDFGSVIFAAIHFALYTYPKKIYLVGCDTNDKGYFFKSDHIVQKDLPKTRKELWLPGYQRVKRYVQLHYPELEIISINPVGLKGIFHDIYTDDRLREQIEGDV